MILNRISENFCDKKDFDKVAPDYNGSRTIAPEEIYPPQPQKQNPNPNPNRWAIVWLPPNPKTNPNLDPNPNPKPGRKFPRGAIVRTPITTVLLKIVVLMMSHIFQVNPSTNLKRDKLFGSPPYSANLKTKVAKMYIRLLDKLFPHNYKCYKLLNRNNIKLSYHCMPSISNVVQKHNSKIMKNQAPSGIWKGER